MLRVLAASAAASLTDVVMLLTLVALAVPVAAATAIGCLCGGAVNYVITRRFVFRLRHTGAWRRFAAYMGVVVGAGAAVSSAVVHVGSVALGLPILVAKAIAAALVLAAWNYPIAKRLFLRMNSPGAA